MPRSYHKELLDRDDIPFPHIEQNMRELDRINTLLGGHAITLQGLRRFLPLVGRDEILYVVEAGCGGGDNLRVIRNWAAAKGRKVRLTGIDRNEACIRFAASHPRNGGIRFIHSDYREVVFDDPPHVIFSSLFCHHFTDEELVSQLQWNYRHARMGFFINDLHRHPLAYHSISLLTRLFSKSYLVKNDAPLSVQRGFKRSEWNTLLAAAGIPVFSVEWKWAFRWLVTAAHA